MEKITSKISDSAKILYMIYIGFTLLEFVLLLFSDMSLFDNIICTLSSVSTAGLSPYADGLAHFNSVYVELVLVVFAILSAINYSLYAFMINGKPKEAFKDTEMRTFLALVGIATVLVSASLYFSGTFDSIPQALRYAFVQVTSFSTTSGYSLADYSMWPPFCLIIFFLLMLIGGCSSSTCGSLKVIRLVVMFKLALRAVYRKIHPRAVVSIKVGNKPISAEVASQITSFVLAFFFMLLLGSLILSLQGFDFITTISSALSMMANTGIAFGEIGASSNFSMFAEPLQFVLALLMIVGRLEIFTFLILLSPSFWQPDRAID